MNTSYGKRRIPPLSCLLAFEAVARLRSVTKAAHELCITPSAVSHRLRQLVDVVGFEVFVGCDFELTEEGRHWLFKVKFSLNILGGCFIYHPTDKNRIRLKVAVPSTFGRVLLMPRLKTFTIDHPDIDISLQLVIPLTNVQVDAADLVVRYGPGCYPDMESTHLLSDTVTPVASPAWARASGGVASPGDLASATLLHSDLLPWRTWFRAQGIRRVELPHRSDTDDMGMLFDMAANDMGVALAQTRLVEPWLASGRLVRLFDEPLVSSPYAYYLCWRYGTMKRRECQLFFRWLQEAVNCRLQPKTDLALETLIP